MVKTHWLNNWIRIETNFLSEENQIPVLKTTLNTLYCTYNRPLLEYASEVWDGCSQTDAYRLEQVQLNAARIVSGLPVFASLNSLYYETGWETLSKRRTDKKLSLMYKIINNEAPGILQIFCLTEFGNKHITSWDITRTSKVLSPDYVHTKSHISLQLLDYGTI